MKLTKINLHNLSQAELSQKEESMLKGGGCPCINICSCLYEGEQEGLDDSYYGGSSVIENGKANKLDNFDSIKV